MKTFSRDREAPLNSIPEKHLQKYWGTSRSIIFFRLIGKRRGSFDIRSPIPPKNTPGNKKLFVNIHENLIFSILNSIFKKLNYLYMRLLRLVIPKDSIDLKKSSLYFILTNINIQYISKK